MGSLYNHQKGVHYLNLRDNADGVMTNEIRLEISIFSAAATDCSVVVGEGKRAAAYHGGEANRLLLVY